jgi:RNA polymerase sigma-70 factor (ECF subfamily)
VATRGELTATGPGITDGEAFVLLYRDHVDAVHAYLGRRVGRQLADDLLTEVWLRAFRARATFDPARGAVVPWLFGIARNVVRAHWAQQGRTRAPLPPRLDDPWGEVDAKLQAEECLPALRAALLELDDVAREVLLLVAWERLSPTEAAQVLGIPPGTARSRLHRARAVLRARLDDVDEPVSTRPKENAP